VEDKGEDDASTEKRRYILDELSRKSTYLYLIGYVAAAMLFFSFVNPPLWVALLIMLGFGILWTHLFWHKILYSDYMRRDGKKSDDIEGGS
jgi:hypothetical protein